MEQADDDEVAKAVADIQEAQAETQQRRELNALIHQTFMPGRR